MPGSCLSYFLTTALFTEFFATAAYYKILFSFQRKFNMFES